MTNLINKEIEKISSLLEEYFPDIEYNIEYQSQYKYYINIFTTLYDIDKIEKILNKYIPCETFKYLYSKIANINGKQQKINVFTN